MRTRTLAATGAAVALLAAPTAAPAAGPPAEPGAGHASAQGQAKRSNAPGAERRRAPAEAVAQAGTQGATTPAGPQGPTPTGSQAAPGPDASKAAKARAYGKYCKGREQAARRGPEGHRVQPLRHRDGQARQRQGVEPGARLQGPQQASATQGREGHGLQPLRPRRPPSCAAPSAGRTPRLHRPLRQGLTGRTGGSPARPRPQAGSVCTTTSCSSGASARTRRSIWAAVSWAAPSGRSPGRATVIEGDEAVGPPADADARAARCPSGARRRGGSRAARAPPPCRSAARPPPTCPPAARGG